VTVVTAALDVAQVSIHLGGREIVEPTSLSIAPGEFVCIVGASGCGKTTLLRAAGGLLTARDGQVRGAVRRHGQIVDSPSRDVAIVFQDYGRALLPWRTAEGNVSLALEAAGVPQPQRSARIAEALTKVGLAAHSGKFPNQLSGGMQQRLQIARCLVTQPRLVFMDEPTGGLDVSVQARLLDLIRSLVAELNLAVLFVTHDIAAARLLAHRIVVMRHGQIVEEGLADRVLDDPRHPYTQLLVSSVLAA
jgi:NitT/TauT family transport system ATP-binding protein